MSDGLILLFAYRHNDIIKKDYHQVIKDKRNVTLNNTIYRTVNNTHLRQMLMVKCCT